MKRIILFPVIAAMIFYSCKDEVTSPETDKNLITNPSFEENGAGSLKGWLVSGTTNFFRDTPQQGGEFSVGISENWGPAGYLLTRVPVTASIKILQFSCWSKTEALPGEILITIERDTTIYSFSREITDSTWTQYTLTDTINAEEGDSLSIYLKGSISQLLQSKTFFDRCYLELK